MIRVVVTGLVATYPMGGLAWDYLQYVKGFHALGCEVYYLEDTGGWLYVGNPRSPLFGSIHVDSRRKDSRGVSWWKY
ncbi:MAG: hypothetical protein AAB427_05285 [Chloroflexota bacterium]